LKERSARAPHRLDKVRFALRYLLKVERHRGVVALKGVSMEANQPTRGEPKKERRNFSFLGQKHAKNNELLLPQRPLIDDAVLRRSHGNQSGTTLRISRTRNTQRTVP
jgi:hypothetical protein